MPRRRNFSRPFLLAATLVLAPLTVAGCKQSDGERCEIDTDCASGHCANSSTTSAKGGVCGNGQGPLPQVDAAADSGEGSDAAVEMSSAEAAPEVAPEAGAEVAPEARAETAPEAGAETAPEAGAEASSPDSADASPLDTSTGN